jgi:hypothetical protein
MERTLAIKQLAVFIKKNYSVSNYRARLLPAKGATHFLTT